jgi:hypothetical protein
MKPRIEATDFGSITVEGTVFDHDVVIGPDGEVSKRKKKLSKAVYGTSHTISLEEAKYVYGQAAGADRLIVGAGNTAGPALARGGRLLHPEGVRDRAAAHPCGARDLERERGQGGRAVPRHLLSRLGRLGR